MAAAVWAVTQAMAQLPLAMGQADTAPNNTVPIPAVHILAMVRLHMAAADMEVLVTADMEVRVMAAMAMGVAAMAPPMVNTVQAAVTRAMEVTAVLGTEAMETNIAQGTQVMAQAAMGLQLELGTEDTALNNTARPPIADMGTEPVPMGAAAMEEATDLTVNSTVRILLAAAAFTARLADMERNKECQPVKHSPHFHYVHLHRLSHWSKISLCIMKNYYTLVMMYWLTKSVGSA